MFGGSFLRYFYNKTPAIGLNMAGVISTVARLFGELHHLCSTYYNEHILASSLSYLHKKP